MSGFGRHRGRVCDLGRFQIAADVRTAQWFSWLMITRTCAALAPSSSASLGNGTIEAASARDTMEVLREPGRVDLLMTDLAMPDLSGMDLAQLAVHIRPQLRVLYSSGYLRASPTSPVLLHHGPLIAKPWALDELEGCYTS
jgi:CheY-like chemotaxis protein